MKYLWISIRVSYRPRDLFQVLYFLMLAAIAFCAVGNESHASIGSVKTELGKYIHYRDFDIHIKTRIRTKKCDSENYDSRRRRACYIKHSHINDDFYNIKAGYYIYKGIGGYKSNLESLLYLEKSYKNGNLKAGELIAEIYLLYYYDDELKSEWLSYLRDMVDKGYSSSAFLLHIYYSKLPKLDVNARESFKWVRRAASMGDPIAQFLVARAYRFGQGVERDLSVAYQWYLKAARQGVPGAQYAVGIGYKQGLYLNKSEEKSRFWLMRYQENKNK